jgi:hypothetical protein
MPRAALTVARVFFKADTVFAQSQPIDHGTTARGQARLFEFFHVGVAAQPALEPGTLNAFHRGAPTRVPTAHSARIVGRQARSGLRSVGVERFCAAS